MFSPSYYATEFLNSQRGYIIVPNVGRIRRAVDERVQRSTPQLVARREQLAEEARRRLGPQRLRPDRPEATAGRLPRVPGLAASAPRQQPAGGRPPDTTIVVYNGAETKLAATIAYLERRSR